jgi:hypothetical protein
MHWNPSFQKIIDWKEEKNWGKLVKSPFPQGSLLQDHMFFIYPSSFEKRIEFNSPFPKEVAQRVHFFICLSSLEKNEMRSWRKNPLEIRPTCHKFKTSELNSAFPISHKIRESAQQQTHLLAIDCVCKSKCNRASHHFWSDLIAHLTPEEKTVGPSFMMSSKNSESFPLLPTCLNHQLLKNRMVFCAGQNSFPSLPISPTDPHLEPVTETQQAYPSLCWPLDLLDLGAWYLPLEHQDQHTPSHADLHIYLHQLFLKFSAQ